MLLAVWLAFYGVVVCNGKNPFTDFTTHSVNDCTSSMINTVLNGTESVTTEEGVRYNGQLFHAVGMSTNCYIYYGWLHSATDPAAEKGTNIPLPNFGMDCQRKNIMLIRTEGVSMRLLIVIEEFGARVRVQSATSGEFYHDSGTVIFLKLSNDHREEAYTNPVDKGYVIENFVSANYRVFVVTRNHYRIRLYELRVSVGDDRSLSPYLRDDVIDVDPMVIPPFENMFARVVHDLTSTSGGMNSQQNGPTECSRKTGKTGKASGLIFLRRESLLQPRNISLYLAAVPISSLLSNSFREMDAVYEYKNFIYQEKYNRFRIFGRIECLGVMRSAGVYPHDLPMDLNPGNCSFDIPTALQSGYTLSTRKWFDQARFHKRMSHPHSTHRLKERHLLNKGWKGLAPVFFATVAVIVLVSVVASFIVRLRERRARRLARTTSMTSHTR